MEKFQNITEELQRYSAARQKLIDECHEACAEFQRIAETHKAARRRQLDEDLIDLAKQQDEFLNEYRAWKCEGRELPTE